MRQALVPPPVWWFIAAVSLRSWRSANLFSASPGAGQTMLARSDSYVPRWNPAATSQWVVSTAGFRGPEHLVEYVDRELDASVSALEDGLSTDERHNPLITVLLTVELVRGLAVGIRSRWRASSVGIRIA